MQDWKGQDVGLPWAEPESVGISRVALERLDRWVQDVVQGEHDLPMGSVLVARKGRVVHYKGCGESSPGKTIQPDSLYRIYSMTKPITSLALMMLWEEGKVLLEHPIHLYLGDKWKKQNMKILETHGGQLKQCTRNIRVVHLLTHTSGLSYGFMGLEKINPVDGLYQESFKKASKKNESMAEMVDRLAELPLCHEPGAKWNYSYATDVVGRLVEVISGQSLSTFLAERIFKPLNMRDTFFTVDESDSHRFTNIHFDHAEKQQRIDVTAIQKKRQHYHPESRMESGGGGLVSTLRDYARFCQFCLDGGELDGVRLLGRKTFDFVTRNHLPDNQDCAQMTTKSSSYMAPPGIGFGLGFAVSMDENLHGRVLSKGSFYWGGAASTVFWIDPSEDLFVLFYTQVLELDELKLPLRTCLENLVYSSLTDGKTHRSRM